MSDEAKGLFPALLAVQQELPKLQKDAINPHFKNRYISLDSLMSAIRPVLSKHGLVWLTRPCRDGSGEPALSYCLLHAETKESDGGIMPLMMAKSDPQGQGSAITYARRYAILAVLGLVADEDDDGHKASEGVRNQSASQSESVSAQDIEGLKRAAKGLSANQIKMALTACGIPVPSPLVWNAVPKAKASILYEALSETPRAEKAA